MEKDSYLKYYILSLFDKDLPLKNAQLIHILHERRTPSMMFLVEKLQLYSAWGLFKDLSKKELQSITTEMVNEGFLLEIEEELFLSDQGEVKVKAFFSKNRFPKNIKQMKNVNSRQVFWERLQLFVQVISELQYKNRYYSPIIKHPKHQLALKKWLAQQSDSRDIIATKWSHEIVRLFSTLSEESANRLAFQLSGHEQLGKTSSQVAKELKETPIQMRILMEDILEEVITVIETNEWPLLNSLLTEIKKETNYGLSQSSFKTGQYIAKGLSIQEIAQKRRLKVNTIREHILEIAIIQQTFAFRKYIPDQLFKELWSLFLKESNLSFKDAKNHFSEIEFMHFRLTELEFIRNQR